MNLKIGRVNPNHLGFMELIKMLDRELWERNPGRQNDYVSLNILSPETRAVLISDKEIPVASGAFRNLGNGSAEIKRMFVKPEYRGKGISKLVLSELENWAKEEGISTIILETGRTHFEAISLYQKCGYFEIENYGPYKNLPESVCMGKRLSKSF